MTSPIHFSSSDAWLLHAIGMAGQNFPTSLRNIVATGDYVNHAIFTWEEIEGGLSRLIQAGFIEVKGQGIKLTARFAKGYAHLTGSTKVVFRQGEALRAYLQTFTLLETKNTITLPFTETEFIAAVQEYQKSASD